MDAEVISIGSEIMLGDLVDTNSTYIAQKLREIGVKVCFKSSVGDDIDRLKEAIGTSLKRTGLIITTGGIGPTADDVTREAVAEVIGQQLILFPDLLKSIEDFFTRRGLHMTPNNMKQAYIPAKAIPIPNPVGTAPSFIAENENGIIISLPGVPYELKYLMENSVVPFLKERFKIRGDVIKTRILKLAGIGESIVDHKLQGLFSMEDPVIGLLAKSDGIEVRITARAEDEHRARSKIEAVEKEVRHRLGHLIYGADEDTIEAVIARLLAERDLNLSVVELLSGGVISQKIASCAAAAHFARGIVVTGAGPLLKLCFADEAEKGVKSDASPARAAALAKGIKKASGSTMGLSVDGQIEPEESIKGRYKATAYIAVEGLNLSSSKEYKVAGAMSFVYNRTAITALEVLRRHIIGIPQDG